MFIHRAIIQDSSVPLDALWMICPPEVVCQPHPPRHCTNSQLNTKEKKKKHNLAVSYYEQHQNLNRQSSSLTSHTPKTETRSKVLSSVEPSARDRISAGTWSPLNPQPMDGEFQIFSIAVIAVPRHSSVFPAQRKVRSEGPGVGHA